MARALDFLMRLEELKFEFGIQAAKEKLRCLQDLKARHLKSADQILRLHEVLCFIQAWPDSAKVLSLAEHILARFDHRRDVKQHVNQLADTGVAGAPIHFSFYAATASWLAERWPDRLNIDWDEFEQVDQFESYLSLLATSSEAPAIDSVALEPNAWIKRLKGRGETDGAFVVRRLKQLVDDEFLHERIYEEFDIPLIVVPGPTTPCRTRAKYNKSPVAYQTTALSRARPAVSDEMQYPPGSPKLLSRAEGSRLVDLARSAMVTRMRDLDAFAYADPNDVSLVDDGDGLQFVLYGLQPQRRFLLETQYGFLHLQNGVPVGYGAVTCLFNSAEVAYTVFDTFRGAESARVYVRTLVMVSHIFGCDTFMIDPYQLGEDNEDALRSGAWWFYQKLGYRPRSKELLRLMKQELAKMKQRPRHRSSLSVLKQLASENVYLNLGEPRDDVLGVLNLANVSLKIADLFANRFGSRREEGEDTLAAEAAQQLGVQSFRGWSAGEKLAWRRWAPLVALLETARWPTAEKRTLVKLIRAKGGRSELDYLRRFDGHRLLRELVLKLAPNAET